MSGTIDFPLCDPARRAGRSTAMAEQRVDDVCMRVAVPGWMPSSCSGICETEITPSFCLPFFSHHHHLKRFKLLLH